MIDKNIEITKVLKFSKETLNKQNISHNDYVFHSAYNCNNKILILTNFKTKNIQDYINIAYRKGIKGLILDKRIPSKIFQLQ